MPIKFKEEELERRFQECHPLIQGIVGVMAKWCSEENLPLVVTAAKTTLEEDQALDRVSKTHREGRAVDLSVQGWSSEQINKFSSYFNVLYKDVAAITKARVPRLVVWHNSGHGDHLHVQIRRLP